MAENENENDEGHQPPPKGGHGERLTRLQEKAISALLTSANYVTAAQAVGVHPATLRAWAKMPCFAAAFEQARRELLANTIARLQTASHGAIAALTQELTNDDVGVRIRVASLLLEHMRSSTETLTLSDRVTALESALKLKNVRSK